MKSTLLTTTLLPIILSLLTTLSTATPWAISYSPFNSDSSCKSSETLSSDISLIASKGFQGIRIYSTTDCGGIQAIGPLTVFHNMWVIAGIYISSTGISGAEAQFDALLAYNQWAGHIKLVVVGNEALQNGYVSARDLADFTASVKSRLNSAGYYGPISTAETVGSLRDGANELCNVMDITSANVQPYFDSSVDAAGAGEFVDSMLEQLRGICPGKDAYVLETGWPKRGEWNGNAHPGDDEQRMAIQGIRDRAEGWSVFFSYEDEEWKQPGVLGVEQHWGCIGVF